MKRTIAIILVAVLSAVMMASAVFADEELPSFVLDKAQTETGTLSENYSFVVIDKASGEVKPMVFKGTGTDFNPGRNIYLFENAEGSIWDYAYCFIHQTTTGCTMHPANNGDPAVCFTAPKSGSIEINYVIFGGQTTRLEFYKNKYSADTKFDEHVSADPANGTDFKATVEVKKGDKIYVALDCIDDNANDETNAWVNSIVYTAVNPDTADSLVISAVAASVAMIGLGAVVARRKEH